MNNRIDAEEIKTDAEEIKTEIKARNKIEFMFVEKTKEKKTKSN